LTIAIFILAGFCTGGAYAEPPTAAANAQVAPVIIDGSVLFHVAGASIFPAEKRAKEIAQRIRGLAKDPKFDPSSLQVREEEGVYVITAGNLAVLAILPDDLQATGLAAAQPSFVVQQAYLNKIVDAIHSYRDRRTSGNLLRNGLQALLRTAVLILLMFALYWLFRKVEQLLEKYVKSRIEKLEERSHHLLRSQHIWSVVKNGVHLVRLALMFSLIYLFFNFVLNLFPWTNHAAQALLGYVTKPLLVIMRAIVDYLPNIFFLTVFLLFVRYLLKLARAFFKSIEGGQLRITGFDAEWALPTYRIVRTLVVLLSIVVAYPYIPGSHSEAFKSISILVGVLVSLGSTSITSNILAGYSIIYRRAFKVGDWVKIGGHIGKISQIRLLVTNMRSLKNEMIVIPNSTLLNNEIVNFSALAATNGLILHTTVGIGYEVPWRQVEAMLLLAAERTLDLMRTPRPFVLQTALNDFSITYELNVFCSGPEKMLELYSDLHRNIQDVFNEYHVQIMTPHYIQDTQEPKVVPREKWHIAPATPLASPDQKDPLGSTKMAV